MLKYIPERFGPLAISPNNGFWVYEDQVFDVSSGTHILFIIDHPELVGITSERIQSTYQRYHERIGTEGEARDELVRLVASSGWVRVRHYSKPKDYWSIQCDSTEKRGNVIKDFILWAMENRVMSETDAAVILSFDNPKDRHEVRWESGGIKAYLNGR